MDVGGTFHGGMSPFVYPKALGGRNLLRVGLRNPYTRGVNTRTREETMTDTTAAEYLSKANQHEQDAIDSFDRCDTDGFVSQWASGVMAAEARLNAHLANQDGKSEFPALFDLAGNLIAAKLVTTRYGECWGILSTDDPSSRITKFVGAFPKRVTTMTRKGYYEGTVRCPAHAALAGSGTGISAALTVRPYIARSDRGFSRDVEIVDNGHCARS